MHEGLLAGSISNENKLQDLGKSATKSDSLRPTKVEKEGIEREGKREFLSFLALQGCGGELVVEQS